MAPVERTQAVSTDTRELWPPDWRSARADACEAVCIRLGVILAELDELEQVLWEDMEVCSVSRQLAGRVRERRNGFREEAERLRTAAVEVAA